MEDEILSLIETHYSSFTRIIKQNSQTDTEGKILLLSSAYEIFTKQEGKQSPSFQSLMRKFIMSLDSSIINIIEKNGVGPVEEYIVQRCKDYETEMMYQVVAEKGTVPMGICFCLFKSPLSKYEYLKCIRTNNGYTVTKMDTELFQEKIRRKEGIIGNTDEYSYNDLNVILKFCQTYFPTRIRFEQKLERIIRK